MQPEQWEGNFLTRKINIDDRCGSEICILQSLIFNVPYDANNKEVFKPTPSI